MSNITFEELFPGAQAELQRERHEAAAQFDISEAHRRWQTFLGERPHTTSITRSRGRYAGRGRHLVAA